MMESGVMSENYFKFKVLGVTGEKVGKERVKGKDIICKLS